MDEGLGRLGMEEEQTVEGGLVKCQRGAHKTGPGYIVEGDRVPHISVMHHRCTGCWCQRA